MTERADQRVVVVTGGGAGIGAAVAEELGRQGCFVVTVDPLLTIDGSAPLPASDDTTAGRIVAAGGTARASAASVTDGPAITALLAELVAERGRLDAVINVAGITRPTSYGRGSDEDWRTVLEVHLEGYLNVLRAALPVMVAAGRGQVVGVTSGSGWRAADAGAYSCAKRAVAALTWQLGRVTPPGVTVNAMSPIAVTRMVTAAIERAAAAAAARPGGAGNATGGLSLGSMPEPEAIGPFGAHLVDGSLGWLRGQVLFAGGPEVAVVEEPRLLEVLRTDGIESLPAVLDAVSAGALVPAEAAQATTGATNPRFGDAFADPAAPTSGNASTALVITDRATTGVAIAAALEGRGLATHVIPSVAADVASATGAIGSVADVDVIVVAAARPGAAPAGAPWERILGDHATLVGEVEADTVWPRAAAAHAAASGRAVRLVTVTDAASSGGRSRAQAVAQLSRSSRRTAREQVAGFSVSMEGTDDTATAELVAHLAAAPEALALAGAELATGDGWIGLRSHPRPLGSVVLGGPTVPAWLDGTLRDIVGVPDEEAR